MPVNVSLRNLNPPPRKGNSPPLIQTVSHRRFGSRVGDLSAPILRFTDIISGPSTGLGDGLGVGSVVTVWGQGFGILQGSVFVTDSLGVKRSASHIYYWQQSNGQAPASPAQLWRSHLMYECAFSLPECADGLATISIEKADGTASVNSLPFTVRAGRILWLAPDGNNANVGTFESPKAYINAGASGSSGLGNSLQAGDIVYSRGVKEPLIDGRGMYIRGAMGTLENQIAIVAYPTENHSEVEGDWWGVHPYLSEAIVLSKYKVSVGHITIPPTGTVIEANPSNNQVKCSKNGRAVGNYLFDREGFCSTGQSGAFVGNGNASSGYQVLGNHIYDVGCDGTSHYQHTTYLTVRDSAETVDAWAIEFNFLEDCKAKYGIHSYDEAFGGNACGIINGTLKINFNVVVNQKGSAINIETSTYGSGVDCWDVNAQVIGNVAVNCGMGPVAEPANGVSPFAITIGGDWNPELVTVESNLIYGYSDESSREIAPPAAVRLFFRRGTPAVNFNQNVIVSFGDYEVIREQAGNTATLSGTHNAYHRTVSGTNTLPVSLSDSIIDNVGVILNGYIVDIQPDSPLRNVTGLTHTYNYDIYGSPRANTVGPIEV